MAGKNTAAFGLYSDRLQVDTGVHALLTAGFRNVDISVLFPDNEGTKDFALEKSTKAPEGATAGVGAGGALGGAVGLLVGIGALAIPGLGPFIAAGPIVAALAGMGAGGAVGGLVGALAGMGIPEYEAIRYDGRMRKGGILVSVHCDNSDWTARAKDILKRTGAEDIASTGEASADYGKTDRPLPRTPPTIIPPTIIPPTIIPPTITPPTITPPTILPPPITPPSVTTTTDYDSTDILPRTRTGGNTL